MDKLGPVLARHLGAVAAPDELWERVRHPYPRRHRQVVQVQIPVLALVTCLLVAGATWSLVRWQQSVSVSPQELALRALSRGPGELEFRSDTVGEIRAWVKSRTGLDIPLPAMTPQEVRMTGVCAVRGGTPAVEVAYRVKGRKAALVVSQAGAGMSSEMKHRFLKCESVGDSRVSSWTMHGQLYTLAYAAHEDLRGDARDECLLCHSGGAQLSF